MTTYRVWMTHNGEKVGIDMIGSYAFVLDAACRLCAVMGYELMWMEEVLA